MNESLVRAYNAAKVNIPVPVNGYVIEAADSQLRIRISDFVLGGVNNHLLDLMVLIEQELQEVYHG